MQSLSVPSRTRTGWRATAQTVTHSGRRPSQLADSKQLSAESRESFFNTLLAGEGPARDLGWRAKVLHPEYISNCMLRREKYNLNELSYDAVFGTVAGLLAAGVAVSEAFVDTLGQAEKYEAVLTAKFPGVKFVVRSKADSLFPVVGAASIVAKVLRDDLLAAWGIGASGYPGDPQTVSWLRENVDPVFGFPSVVRFSWSSCAALLQEKCCPVTWCDADDDGHAGRDARRPQKSLLSKRSTVPPSRLLLCDLFPTAEGAKKQKY